MNNEEKTIVGLDLDAIIKIIIYSTKNKDYKTLLLNYPVNKQYAIVYEQEEEFLTYEQTKNFIQGIFNDSEKDDRIIIEAICPTESIKFTKKL